MSATVQLEATDVAQLNDLAAKIHRYQELTGKTAAAVLLQKGAQIIFGNSDARYGKVFPGLFELFKGLAPEPGSIWAAARARHFRLGRTVYGGALSPKAIARAEEMMGGNKTILISTNQDGGGLSFVRRGARKRRVHFRHGRLSFAVSGTDESFKRNEGDKAVNLRAVATFFELQLREQGRRFLGAAWLINRWRRLAQSDPLRQELGTFRILKNNNPRSTLGTLGEAQLEGDPETGAVGLRITSFVPGTLAVGKTHGVFSTVLSQVRADLAKYLASKEREAFRAA